MLSKIANIKKSVISYLLIVISLLISVIFLSMYINIKNNQIHMKSFYLKQIDNSINRELEHFIKDYTFHIKRLLNTSNIVELLIKKDREGMYKLLKPRFDFLRLENKNLTIMHIHSSDGNSFLRVHKPKIYGDNIAEKRAMIREIHKNHKMISGYETGLYSTTYRIIMPLFDKNKKYIGAIELGINPDYFIDSIYDINGFHGIYFIKESQLQLYSKLNNIIINGYKLQSNLNGDLKNICNKLKLKNNFINNTILEVNGTKYLTYVLTLKNFQQQDSVKIVLFQNVSNIEYFFDDIIFQLYIIILFFFLIWSFFVYRRISSFQFEISSIYNEHINKLKKSENKYLIEKNKLNNIFMAMQDGIYIVDDKYNIEYVNDILVKDFGKYNGRKCYEYFHGRSDVCEWCKNEKVQAGETIRWERLSDKDGKTYDLIDTPLHNEDGTISKLEIFRDISDSKELKDKLEFNQNYLQVVFNAVPFIMITTNGYEIDRANTEMLNFFNYETIDDFKREHSCLCDYFLNYQNHITSKVNGVDWLDYMLLNPDKLHKISIKKENNRYTFIAKAYLLNIDSKKRSVVTLTDVTKIEDLSDRLEIAVSGTQDGLWDWNLENGDIYFSPQWKKQLGYKDYEFKNELETWTKHIHPDDEKKTINDYTLNIEGTTKFYENIHRLQHKDGSWVWILDRGKTTFDEHGKAIRITGFHTDITKQKLLEDKLIKLKQQFEQFMEFMPASIIIKENDIVIYANSLATKYFHTDSIIGKYSYDLFSSPLLEKIKKFENDVYQNGFKEEILEYQDKNNKKTVYRNMAFLIDEKEKKRLGIVSIDITKEYHANREIAKVLSAFERSDISVVITDVVGNIQYVNPSWCEITGYSKEELLGQNPRIVKSGSTSPQDYEKMWKELTNGKVWHSELINRAKDGTKFWEDSTIMPSFDNNGVVDGYIAFKLEINDKIKLKQELKYKEEIMIAQSRHAAMGEMISMIAHQWRQPISVIAMDANNILVDIELDSVENDSLQTDLSDILDQTKYLSKTIDDFRNFFKPTKIKDEVIVSDVFKDSFSIIAKSLENNNIEVISNFNSKTQVLIYSRELLQVFINILKNAKEVLVEKRENDRKIINNIYEKNGYIIISICDNAGGIKDDVIQKIFNPYFTTKDEMNGTGLGLYMSKTIIEKHFSGSILAFNKNDGACFEIKFPIKREIAND